MKLSFMEKILIYLLKGNKKYAVSFNNEQELKNIKNIVDIPTSSIITNGNIKDVNQILERWEISSTKIKTLNKTTNSLTMLVEVDCKLLLRKVKK